MKRFDENLQRQTLFSLINSDDLDITKYPKDLFPHPIIQKIYELARKFKSKYEEKPSKEFILLSSNEIRKEQLESFKNELNLVFGCQSSKFLLDQLNKYVRRLNAEKQTEYLINQLQSKTEFDDSEITQICEHFSKINEDVEVKSSAYAYESDSIFCMTHEAQLKIPTFSQVWNQHLGGGISENSLNCLIGVMGTGKTSYLVNLAIAAMICNFNVAFYSLEETQKEITIRINKRLSGMSFDEIADNQSKAKDRIDAILSLGCGKLTIDYLPPVTPDYILRNIKEKPYPIDLVIIDYASNLTPSKRYREEYDNLKSICYDLKDKIAVGHNTQVWTAAQMNRSGAKESKTTIISDSTSISGSFSSLFPCNSVYVFNKPNEDTPKDQDMLVCVKNRDGKTGFKVPFFLDLSRMTIVDYPTQTRIENREILNLLR